MATIVQNANPASETAEKVDQKLSYRGAGSDGLHRVQVDESSADADGVVTRRIGFIETTSMEAANKLMQDLASGKKIATLGGRQQRNGNIYSVTVGLAAA